MPCVCNPAGGLSDRSQGSANFPLLILTLRRISWALQLTEPRLGGKLGKHEKTPDYTRPWANLSPGSSRCESSSSLLVLDPAPVFKHML